MITCQTGFDRRRRTPFFYAAPRFWKSHKVAEEEDNDEDEDDEGEISDFFIINYVSFFVGTHLSSTEVQPSFHFFTS